MEEQRLSYQREFTEVTAEQKAKTMKDNNRLQSELKESKDYIRYAGTEASIRSRGQRNYRRCWRAQGPSSETSRKPTQN